MWSASISGERRGWPSLPTYCLIATFPSTMTGWPLRSALAALAASALKAMTL
jgi:hypothetical protein